MADRVISMIPLDEIVDAVNNPKTHDEPLLDASLARFGFIEPMVRDDRTGRLVSGHGRRDMLRRARSAGIVPDGVTVTPAGEWLVPVAVGWASANDDEAAAAVIALNRTTESGGWDDAKLAAHLRDLAAHDVSFDGIGFDLSAIDDLLAGLDDGIVVPGGPPITSEAAVPAADETPQRAQRGDVWACGPHRVMCGDCRDHDDVTLLLDGATVNLAFTSPPYAEQREYDPSSGFRPVPPDEYVEWFAPVAANVAAHLAADGSWFVNIKPAAAGLDTELYVFDLVLAHAREWGWHYATEFCWERVGVPKMVTRRFKNQFEPVYQFTRGDWKSQMRPDAVRHWSANVPVPFGPGAGDTSWATKQGDGSDIFGAAKKRKNGTRQSMGDAQGINASPGEYIVEGLAYPGNRLPTFSGSHEALGHGAAFPVGLPGWFCLAYTDEGDTVYDPFGGSGSTLIAAHQHNRIGYTMEISAGYVDTILARWERHSGGTAVRVVDGGAR